MSEEGSCDISNPEKNKNIRCATIGDIDALIEICRICFPNYLIWCTNRCARKWWEYIIGSKSQEAWVYQFNNQIVAMIRIVNDAKPYKKEIKRLKPRFSTLFCVFIVRPRLLFEKIMETINRVASSSVKYSDSSSVNSLTNKSMWLHTSAVLPGMRGKGIGTSMMRFCEQRAVELGFDSVKCIIKTNNNDSIRFHERLGFIRTGKIKDCYSYIKLLSKNHRVDSL